MLMNIFVIWILISVFSGNREAGRTLRTVFGVIAGLWALRWILCFGIGLLPVILLVLLFTNVAAPFLKGFADSMKRHE